MSPDAAGPPCVGHPDSGPSTAEIDTYIAAVVARGEYPHLAEFVGKDMSLGVKAEKFEIGLEWLLAGIEAEVAGAAGG
jgi:hypothetical protein